MAAMRPIEMVWESGQQFTGGREGGPSLTLDGDSRTAASPVDALVAAAATCTGIDVVLILEKMRQPFTALAIRVQGTRADETPKRLTRLELVYVVTGRGLDAAKVARAAELSTEKYCSVMQSLAPDIATHWSIELVEG